MQDSVRQHLHWLFSQRDAEIGLAEAALWAAKLQYPDLDVKRYLERLDEWGEQVRQRLSDTASAEEIVLTLNYFLFQELEFRANEADYYDPRNSYFNEVMDRKLGIPITLSMIYIEVGRRAGLPLEGVSFPGHYVVKFSLEYGEVVLDPYSGGISLEESDLEELLLQTYGDSGDPRPPINQLLEGATVRETLVRLLRNLKSIYMRNDDFYKALSTVDLILMVEPDLSDDMRDRGFMYQKLDCFRAAYDSYQEYLAMEPNAEDTEEIREQMILLQRQDAQLH